MKGEIKITVFRHKMIPGILEEVRIRSRMKILALLILTQFSICAGFEMTCKDWKIYGDAK
jgi:hypothetical protein